MPEERFMTIEEADLTASSAAHALLTRLDQFNAAHPDPDAERVAEYFDYFTPNYVTQICASVLAERYLVLPQTPDQLASMTESTEDRDEVEMS